MHITVVTTMRNEGPFVLEWLAYLKSIGVSEVLVYTNECDDGTDDLLDALAPLGWITHIRQTLEKRESPQWKALKDAWTQPAVKRADWALVCDVDEFPEIKVGAGTLVDLINAIGDADAISMPWRLFGNSRLVSFVDQPVTTQFLKCAGPHTYFPVATTFFKTLFRVNGPFSGLGVHRPKQKNPDRHGLPKFVGGSGHRLPQNFVSNPKRLSLAGTPAGRDLVDLRHYSLKSIEAFLVKHHRGLPNRSSKPIDLTYWVNRNFNAQTVDPLTVPAYDWPKAATDYHHRAVDWYQSRIRAALRSKTGYALYADLVLAGDTLSLSPTAAGQLYKLYQSVDA